MEQFDRDAPLFDRRLQVLVQYADREEKLQPLTIRLLNGVRVRYPYLFSLYIAVVTPNTLTRSHFLFLGIT